jgi:hypothetical protein
VVEPEVRDGRCREKRTVNGEQRLKKVRSCKESERREILGPGCQKRALALALTVKCYDTNIQGTGTVTLTP